MTHIVGNIYVTDDVFALVAAMISSISVVLLNENPKNIFRKIAPEKQQRRSLSSLLAIAALIWDCYALYLVLVGG